jgi:hypothetical protein
MGPLNGPYFGPALHILVRVGPKKRPHKNANGQQENDSQATALWTWSNFLHDHVPINKRIVRINFDETSVQLFAKIPKGNVTAPARRQKQKPRSLKRNTYGANVKLALTHIVMVCDDYIAQQKLPQLLLVRAASLSAEATRELQATLAPNVIIMRLEKAWVNEMVIKELVVHLRAALLEFKHTHAFILYADAFKAHATSAVWQAYCRAGFHCAIIPASMTWSLQPCDVYVLSMYKLRLVALWTRSLSIKGREALRLTEVIRCVNQTVESFLTQMDWSTSFTHLGLVGHQELVSWSLLDKLCVADIIRAPRSLPTLAELQAVFPRRANLPIDDMFALYMR